MKSGAQTFLNWAHARSLDVFQKKCNKYNAEFETVTHFRYIMIPKPWVLAIEMNETMILSQM